MDTRLLAQLNDADLMLWRETEREAMAPLDEDGVSELHDRIRRARNKYTGQYRREASARVAETGGRGKARPANARNAARAEVFEEALNRVSRRLAVLSRQSATDLRTERLGEYTVGTELHRSETLAIVQVLVLYHLVNAKATVALGGDGTRNARMLAAAVVP